MAKDIVAEVVTRPTSRYSDGQLSSIGSFADAMRLAAEVTGDEVAKVDGIRFLGQKDKHILINVPLVFLEWDFIKSDRPNAPDYVQVLCVADEEGGPVKYRFSDSSSGIAKELRAYSEETGKVGGVFLPYGLRVSDYYLDPKTRKPLTREQVDQYKAHSLPMESAATFYCDVKV